MTDISKTKELVKKYIELIAGGDDLDESYKYESIQTFQDNWNIEAVNFKEMFENAFSKRDNLLYHTSYSFIIDALNYNSDGVRQMFRELYNESIPLGERILSFQEKSEDLAQLIKNQQEKNQYSHQQDERTIATYLAFKYPEKYPIYKASFYKFFCEYLGIKPVKAGERYIHYIELVNQTLNQGYITDELRTKHHEVYPVPTWNDDLLIVQNVLFVSERVEKSEFEINNLIDERFSWVQTHKKIVEYLKDQQGKQKELIELLKSVGITPFNDKTKEGEESDIELDEIDPFTFFCYIYKYGSKRRLIKLQKIAEALNITVPNGDSGLPSANAQRVWLFPMKYLRNNNEIERLWNFFFKALEGELTDEIFADVLEIRNVGKTKLTEGLFYILPETYFPINGPSKPYLEEVFGINAEFNTYSEYWKIVKSLREKSDKSFAEISNDSWFWADENKKMNFWVFQGNPKIFDFESALRKEVLEDWTVSAHKDKIKEGDKIILWITGDKAGCYALAEAMGSPVGRKDKKSADDDLWLTDNTSELKVEIQITHNLVDDPILLKDIKKLKEFSKLNVGHQGTNFTATENEYKTFLKIKEEREEQNIELLNLLKLFQPQKLFQYYDFLDEIIEEFGLEEGDERLVFNLRKNRSRLIFTVGQRYAWVLEGKGEKTIFRFISDIYIDETTTKFEGAPEAFYTTTQDYSIVIRNKTTILKAVQSELIRSQKSGFLENNYQKVEQLAFNKDFRNEIFARIGFNKPETNTKMAKNIILYGPPGTGKTYTLRNKYIKQYTITEESVTKEMKLEEAVSELTWWQVLAIAMIDIGKECKVSELMENDWIKAKISLSESKNIRANIWGNLQYHTVMETTTVNLARRLPPLIFDKTPDSKWKVLRENVQEQAPELYEIYESVNNFKPSDSKEIKNYDFITFHQSFTYEDFIEGIKPTMEEGQEGISYEIVSGIFKRICKRAENDPNNRYAIFIDEINRGNISQIFGELITLIEPDKRIGADNEMRVKLPYSKMLFGVPKNLDIYGTMNTADRSVEALDTALRRRFSFVEMLPKPELLKDSSLVPFQEVNLSKLLETINDRVEALIDKDHQIGHSYFIGIQDLEDLKLVFQDKIIPLLEEYFYGSLGKIGLILGANFIKEKENKAKFSQNFNLEDDFIEEKRVYQLVSSENWTVSDFISIYEG